MEPTSLPIAPGDVLAGKYRVEGALGHGGMGLVLAARHLHLDEPVAIKLLRAELARDEAVVERFLREARAAAKIKSEHVVRVLDVDRLESGTPYIVMERLDGEDLAAVCQRRGRLEIDEAARYIVQACDALAEAHAVGVVHRDLKPANLFLAKRRDGRPLIKVLDFGISKIIDPDGGQAEITRTAVALGTPSYMAPEQMVSSRRADRRADIWALGVVLYRLLTGALPFQAQGAESLGMRVLTASPAPLRSHRRQIPAGLEAIVLRCLEKQADDRFATVFQLAEALRPYEVPAPLEPPVSAGRASVPASPPSPPPAPVAPPASARAAPSPSSRPVAARPSRPPPSRRAPGLLGSAAGVGLLAALALVAGVGVGVVLFRPAVPGSASAASAASAAPPVHSAPAGPSSSAGTNMENADAGARGRQAP
jgi:serine/threonine-protein kinase